MDKRFFFFFAASLTLTIILSNVAGANNSEWTRFLPPFKPFFYRIPCGFFYHLYLNLHIECIYPSKALDEKHPFVKWNLDSVAFLLHEDPAHLSFNLAHSTAAVERIFSIVSCVKTKQRNLRMTGTLEAIPSIRALLYGRGLCCRNMQVTKVMLDLFTNQMEQNIVGKTLIN